MIKHILTIVLLTSYLIKVEAQQTIRWGDQGNGTFRNPVLPADYSDPDFIRIGEDYYGISSTLQESPGMVIIHSKDLVNWEIAGHVINDISILGGDMNWDKMVGYDQGVYAGSLRYHNNKFYVYFTTKKTGWFVAVADHIEGPWSITSMLDSEGKKLIGYGWDDNCPFWDDDGSAYIIASNFGKGEWCPHLYKMNADGTQLLDGVIAPNSNNENYLDIVGGSITHPYRTSEANKIFKRNGYYYFFFSEVRKSHGFDLRIPVLLRSKNIYGPYELKELLHSQGTDADKEPNQGTIIDSPDEKDWFFITHHGTGHFSGRFLSVLPVTWDNDWPQVGKDIDNDSIGEMVWEMKKTITSKTPIKMQTSDEFATPKLGLQWQWNHQPRADKWSLTENPGYLRLKAFKPLEEGNFFKTGNTIGQRYYRSDKGIATVKIDIGGMTEGQEAGLCHYDGGKSFASVGTVMSKDEKYLAYTRKDNNNPIHVVKGLSLPKKAKTIYLRMIIDFYGRVNFEYSLDNKKFSSIGTTSQLSWAWYRSSRLGIYNYNKLQDTGSVDVDWFHYDFKN